MASEKIAAILRAKAMLSADEIVNLSDEEGWHIVYKDAAAKRRPRDERPQICLTGFTKLEHDELSAFAEASRMKVTTSVTADLAYLCVGATPGPMKLAKAISQGVIILDEPALRHLIG